MSADEISTRRPAEVVLRTRDLVKHYPVTQGPLFRRTIKRVHAVDHVDLELRKGETLGVVGESGCGKSTLARVLSLIERPTGGTVEILGSDTAGWRGRRLRAQRRYVQMVFQDPFTSLNPRMTVGDIVKEPFNVHRDISPRNERAKRVAELMDLVGLNPDHQDRYPHQFSGGQRQRIGIARALALRPQILVCDEPVSALDVSIQAQIVNLLQRLQTDLGLSYVFIAHDLAVVQHIAHEISVMYLGKVVESGSASEVYNHVRHPYTEALLSAAPSAGRGDGSRNRRIVLQGDVPSPVSPPSGCRFRTRCWMAEETCAAHAPALMPVHASGHVAACHFVERTDGDSLQRHGVELGPSNGARGT